MKSRVSSSDSCQHNLLKCNIIRVTRRLMLKADKGLQRAFISNLFIHAPLRASWDKIFENILIFP